MPESSWLSPRRRPMRGRGPDSAAFTLIEMLGVLAIVGILLGIVFAVGQGVQERGRVARARAELAVLAAALDSYKLQYGDYPRVGGLTAASPEVSAAIEVTTPEASLFNALLGVLRPDLTQVMGEDGNPALGRVFVEGAKFTLEIPGQFPDPTAPDSVANSFLDPWGRRYQYRYKNAASPSTWTYPSFVLWSVGSDGVDALAGLPSTGLPPSVAGADDLIAGR